MKKAILHCDGASSGNPGKSGIGVVLSCDGKTCEISEYIGTATNNVAEYTALIRGLEKAKAMKADSLEIFLDSELLVKQMLGIYAVKNERLKAFHARAVSLLREFKDWKIQHIPRSLNRAADSLARKAILYGEIKIKPK